jgi:hemoglobin
MTRWKRRFAIDQPDRPNEAVGEDCRRHRRRGSEPTSSSILRSRSARKRSSYPELRRKDVERAHCGPQDRSQGSTATGPAIACRSGRIGSRLVSSTLYERVGEAFFRDLVARFYGGVAMDPLLRPLYPDDLEGPEEHLRLFLVQYWGGPSTYNEQRGHPRLRMRHAGFSIGLPERDAWLRLMLGALDASAEATGVSSEDREAMLSYFRETATQLINRAGR